MIQEIFVPDWTLDKNAEALNRAGAGKCFLGGFCLLPQVVDGLWKIQSYKEFNIFIGDGCDLYQIMIPDFIY